MNNEQAEVLIEELIQLKLEVAALREEARSSVKIISVPHYIAAAIVSFVLLGAFAIYAMFFFTT